MDWPTPAEAHALSLHRAEAHALAEAGEPSDSDDVPSLVGSSDESDWDESDDKVEEIDAEKNEVQPVQNDGKPPQRKRELPMKDHLPKAAPKGRPQKKKAFGSAPAKPKPSKPSKEQMRHQEERQRRLAYGPVDPAPAPAPRRLSAGQQARNRLQRNKQHYAALTAERDAALQAAAKKREQDAARLRKQRDAALQAAAKKREQDAARQRKQRADKRKKEEQEQEEVRHPRIRKNSTLCFDLKSLRCVILFDAGPRAPQATASRQDESQTRGETSQGDEEGDLCGPHRRGSGGAGAF